MSDVAFWDKIAVKYAKDPIEDMNGYAQTRDKMRAILQPNHRVLELGCGTGSTALELAGGVAEYTGTDISPKMITIARDKQTAKTPSGLRFGVGNSGDITSGAQDVIIALNVLHLVPDLETCLRQIYQGLPEGGIFISKTSLLSDGPFYLPWIIPVMRAFGKAPSVRNLSHDQMLDMITAAGFLVRETLPQDGMVPRLFVMARKE